MSRAIKRGVRWAPLSAEARALIDDGPRFTWRAWRDDVLIAERVGVALADEVETARQSAHAAGWRFESDDGLAWGYVSLACGEAAQLGAFGVACRAPDLFTALEPEPVQIRGVAQMSLFPPDNA